MLIALHGRLPCGTAVNSSKNPLLVTFGSEWNVIITYNPVARTSSPDSWPQKRPRLSLFSLLILRKSKLIRKKIREVIFLVQDLLHATASHTLIISLRCLCLSCDLTGNCWFGFSTSNSNRSKVSVGIKDEGYLVMWIVYGLSACS